MSVLVTGGGGFAGRHLLRALLAAGRTDLSATVLGDASAVVRDGYDDLAAVEWLSMDAASLDSVRDVVARVRPEIVYHLAGQASVGESFEAPLETWDVNATGTLRLLSALQAEDPRFRRLLLVSSAEVYGVVPPGRQPIGEDAPLQPVSPYGLSKAAAELAALQWCRFSGSEVVVARSFNHIGPGQDERFVLPSIALQLTRILRGLEDPVLQVGNMEVERDFLDVRDVTRAYVCLMERGESGKAYNVCSGRSFSLLSVVARMIHFSETGARLEVQPDRVRPVDIPSLRGDAGELTGLGWSPRYGLDETLRDLLDEAMAKA